ncbi:hypothetical protein FACS189414_3800 [Bacteroidia bacterium]|nr:hypothetical protein FACS189414_3800 [Bacteroidia bacterium]
MANYNDYLKYLQHVDNTTKQEVQAKENALNRDITELKKDFNDEKTKLEASLDSLKTENDQVYIKLNERNKIIKEKDTTIDRQNAEIEKLSKKLEKMEKSLNHKTKSGYLIIAIVIILVLLSTSIVLFINNDSVQAKLNDGQIKSSNGKNHVVEIPLVWVQGGTFTMGCTSEQGNDCDSDEMPKHQVTLSSYYIGQYEVTQKQWQEVMGTNPSYFKGDNLPVENVSWDDVQIFLRKLNQETGKTYRLPTEAEWEYAARGGTKSNGYKYSGSNDVGIVAWYNDDSSSKTHPVGTKRANELGIYDMSGNVWEWCSDWYATYISSSQSNPTGATSGSSRVYRGGSWGSSSRYVRVPNRGSGAPGYRSSYLGFRLASSSE